MATRGLKNKISQIESRVRLLEEKLQNSDVSDLDYRKYLREILDDVNDLIEESSNLFSLMSTKEVKKNLNIVFEAFITSDYADDRKQRTDAVLLFSELKLILS